MSSETHVPAEPYTAQAKTWVSVADEGPRWASCAEATASKRAETAGGGRRLEVGVAGAVGRFRKRDRLSRRVEFEHVRRRGERRVSSQFVVVVAQAPGSSEEMPRRLGLTVSRRVAGAVGRNRVKRYVRVWFRTVQPLLCAGTDVVVIARAGAAQLSGRETAVLLTQLLQGVRGMTR